MGEAFIVSPSAGVAHAAKTRLMRYRSVTENISGSISNTRRMSSNASTAIGAAASKNALFNSIFHGWLFGHKDVYDTALPWRQYNKLYGPL